MTLPAARITDATAHGGMITTGLPTVLIGGKPAARVTDLHICPLVTGSPHVGGPIVAGSPTVIVGGLMQARVTDIASCTGPPDLISAGESTVLVGLGGRAPAGALGSWLGVTVARLQSALATSYPRSIVQPDGSIATEYNKSIAVKGTSEFQANVTSRIDTIARTKSGAKLLRQIRRTKRSMSVVEYHGLNSFAGPYPSTISNFAEGTPEGVLVYGGMGQPLKDGNGVQLLGTGSGVDVEVSLNPNLTLPCDIDPNQPMPNDAILFHEMNHGAHFMRGTYNGSPLVNWTTHEERTTIRTGDPSEAQYLEEIGYPYCRVSHRAEFEPQPVAPKRGWWRP